ncbi:MAG: hypothetical protein ACF8XB_03685 [Planctomycetota bacterium JB042]
MLALPLLLLGLFAGDLDGDGADDVVLASARSGDVQILCGRTGEEWVRWPLPNATKRVLRDAAAALVPTGEGGRLEVVLVSAQPGRARVLTPWGEHVRSLGQPIPEGGEPHRWQRAVTPEGGVVVARRGYVVGYGTEHVAPVPVGRVWALDVVDDLDGDGVREFVVERPLADDTDTRVSVVSGRDGSTVFDLEKRTSGRVAAWASSVAAVGDVDGDGTTDVAVGAPHGGLADPPMGTRGDGGVVVHSGRDGAVFHELAPATSFDPFTRFGARIVPVGDVDADGHDDFAVSAYKHDCEPAETQTGSVGVYSGRTGFPLFELFGPPGIGYFGMRMTRPGDANGDGTPDLLISSSLGWFLVSASDGALHWTVEEGPDGFRRVDEWTVVELEGRAHRTRRICVGKQGRAGESKGEQGRGR